MAIKDELIDKYLNKIYFEYFISLGYEIISYVDGLQIYFLIKKIYGYQTIAQAHSPNINFPYDRQVTYTFNDKCYNEQEMLKLPEFIQFNKLMAFI